MNEKNPLYVSSVLSSDNYGKFANKSGRPKAEKAIKFSPLPKSMVVAQMLLGNKSVDHKETITFIIPTDDNEHAEDEAEDISDVNFNRGYSDNNMETKKDLSTLKEYSCDYPSCSYSCKLSSNLIKHKRIHTGEKPYLCDRCSFRSSFVNSLKTHRRIHTSERPYQCKHCTYKCNSSSNLKKHCHYKHSNMT